MKAKRGGVKRGLKKRDSKKITFKKGSLKKDKRELKKKRPLKKRALKKAKPQPKKKTPPRKKAPKKVKTQNKKRNKIQNKTKNIKRQKRSFFGRFLTKRLGRLREQPSLYSRFNKRSKGAPQPTSRNKIRLSLFRKRKGEVPPPPLSELESHDSAQAQSQPSSETQVITLPQPAPQTVSQAEIVEKSPEISPVSSPSSGAGMSTQDFLRPNEQLRQSIEAFLLDQRSPHTRRAYGKDLKRFVLFLHGRKHDQGIESLNRAVLIAYKESLLSEGLEHTTVDRHIATLRSFFSWLVDDGVIEKSPADGVRFMNPKKLSTTRGFSDDEVRKILALPDLHTRTGSQHYAILMVLFYCGLRRSEICELKTLNVSTERNQQILRLRGKGNKERIIAVIPAVSSALKHYLLITGRSLTVDEPLFKPLKNNRTGDLEKPLDPSTIFYIVTKYAKVAGISARVSPHSCRATAISNARDHNVPDRAIQEFAGWASPDMITRYDKRKTSVENSASRSIKYGAEDRRLPAPVATYFSPNSDSASQVQDNKSAKPSPAAKPALSESLFDASTPYSESKGAGLESPEESQ